MMGIDDILVSAVSFPYTYIEYSLERSSDVKITVPHNHKSNKAIFILTHWISNTFLYKNLIKKLKNKYTIVICQFPYKILSQNTKNALKYFNKAKSDIIKLADQLEKNGCRHFSILGVSLSNCLAFMIANSDGRFKKMIINLPGSDLAKCLWESKGTMSIYVKKKIENNGINLKKLIKIWANLAPINNIKNLNKKGILIHLARNDKLIHYKYDLELINAMKKENINFTLNIDNVFGHCINLSKQLIFPKRMMDFLEG